MLGLMLFGGLFQLVLKLIDWILKDYLVSDINLFMKWLNVLLICLLKLAQTYKIINMSNKVTLPQSIMYSVNMLL